MSRSYKKHNYSGWSCAESDKDWKTANHRRFRRKEHVCREEDEFDKIVDIRSVSNSYDAPKDGKQFWDDDLIEDEWCRKFYNKKGKLRK